MKTHKVAMPAILRNSRIPAKIPVCTPKVPTHTRAIPNIGHHLRDPTSLWTLTGMRDNMTSRRVVFFPAVWKRRSRLFRAMTHKDCSPGLIRICLLFAIALTLTVPASAANPVPTVTGPVHPEAVVPGRSDFVLTVYGANFVSGALVNWNGSPRSTTFVSARELRAKILASDVVKPTAGYITVTNPAPGGGPSSSSYAIVEVHQPTTTIAPGQPHLPSVG